MSDLVKMFRVQGVLDHLEHAGAPEDFEAIRWLVGERWRLLDIVAKLTAIDLNPPTAEEIRPTSDDEGRSVVTHSTPIKE